MSSMKKRCLDDTIKTKSSIQTSIINCAKQCENSKSHPVNEIVQDNRSWLKKAGDEEAAVRGLGLSTSFCPPVCTLPPLPLYDFDRLES